MMRTRRCGRCPVPGVTEAAPGVCQGVIDHVLAAFGYQSPYLIDDDHVWTHGLGEQRRYAIRHTLRYQIWELDQPHYLHAHGRAC
jgi:hypothetical protein